MNGLIGNDIGSCEIPEYDGWNAGIIQVAKHSVDSSAYVYSWTIVLLLI